MTFKVKLARPTDFCRLIALLILCIVSTPSSSCGDNPLDFVAVREFREKNFAPMQKKNAELKIRGLSSNFDVS